MNFHYSVSSTCTIPELPEILGFRSSQRKFLRALVLVWQNCDRYMLLTVSGIASKEFFSPVSKFNTLHDFLKGFGGGLGVSFDYIHLEKRCCKSQTIKLVMMNI